MIGPDIINHPNSTNNSNDPKNCVHIIIRKSVIGLLRMHGSFLNTFEDCSINKIIKFYSPDNIFNIREQLEDKGRKSNSFQNNLPLIVILLLALVIVGNNLYLLSITTIRLSLIYSFIPFSLDVLLIFLILIIISLAIVFYIITLYIQTIKMQIKLKKYYTDGKKSSFNSQKLIIGWMVIIGVLLMINI